MEPRIQYAKTEDGVSIAYYATGEGIPLVMLPLWFSPATGSREDAREFYEAMARQKRLVTYDSRGNGMSQRRVDDLSIEALERDLEAVVDELGAGSFALFAPFVSAPVAINYVVRRPDRVSHLILWCPVVRGGGEMLETSQFRGLAALLETDWDLFTEMVAQLLHGFAGGEPSRRFAASIRESVAPETARLAMADGQDVDVSDLLPRVSVPTLVIHRRGMTAPPLDTSRTIAASIPGARLALVEGGSMLPYLEDADAVLATINDFLGVEAPQAAQGGSAGDAGAFRTILFTDVEGSTALTDRLGDAKARDLLREHERLVREALKAHGGSEVKTMGDGFMASFSSATGALGCAIAVQRAFAERNESAEEPIRVRVGLNAGEPIAEDEDLFGTAVNMAARLAAKAEAGEILVADVVRQLVAGKEFLFADRGESEMRGFEDPVRVYEVRWQK